MKKKILVCIAVLVSYAAVCTFTLCAGSTPPGALVVASLIFNDNLNDLMNRPVEFGKYVEQLPSEDPFKIEMMYLKGALIGNDSSEDMVRNRLWWYLYTKTNKYGVNELRDSLYALKDIANETYKGFYEALKPGIFDEIPVLSELSEAYDYVTLFRDIFEDGRKIEIDNKIRGKIDGNVKYKLKPPPENFAVGESYQFRLEATFSYADPKWYNAWNRASMTVDITNLPGVQWLVQSCDKFDKIEITGNSAVVHYGDDTKYAKVYKGNVEFKEAGKSGFFDKGLVEIVVWYNGVRDSEVIKTIKDESIKKVILN